MPLSCAGSLRGKEVEVLFDGTIVQQLRECIRAERCILDGEMMVWDDGEKQEWVAFGQNKSTALGNGRPDWNLAFMAFDCLFVEDPGMNGSLPPFVQSSNLLSNTYAERRDVLARVLREKRNWVEIIGVESKSGRRKNVHLINASKVRARTSATPFVQQQALSSADSGMPALARRRSWLKKWRGL